MVLKVISSVKQDRRQVPEMRYQRFFFLLCWTDCWKIWDKPKNANYSEMTIHHHKFYGIDKQNGVRLKIAITIILDVSFIILNSFWYKSVNETLNIKAAVRPFGGLKCHLYSDRLARKQGSHWFVDICRQLSTLDSR